MISYNPGYQSVLKDLKPSTRQRFVAIAFGYPDAEREAMIIAHESGVDAAIAERLAVIGAKDATTRGSRLRRRRQHAPADIHRHR